MISSNLCPIEGLCSHYNTLQHTATHCNTLQRTATHCNSPQLTATHYNNIPSFFRFYTCPHAPVLEASQTHSCTHKHLYTHMHICTHAHIYTHIHSHTHTHTHKHTRAHTHTKIHANTRTNIYTPQVAPTCKRHSNALQHSASHCNSLQLTATLCSTLQQQVFFLGAHTYTSQVLPARKQHYSASHCITLQHNATHCNNISHMHNTGGTCVRATLRRVPICQDYCVHCAGVGVYECMCVRVYFIYVYMCVGVKQVQCI